MGSGREDDAAKKALGRKGEDIACGLLEERGCVVLSRNVRVGHKEMDIVCAEGADIRFVEVKTRRLPMEGEPWEAVNAAKQRNIAAAARRFLSSAAFRAMAFNPDECHFDVITVVWDEKGEKYATEYIPDAFYMIY